ncbi:hypothetical protein CEUSTIGMA_g4507.t1 [Chlamydomonas eustigma]|uniref:Uncharacterized protein n=1 Tax=Chlamydomonas eustigma TaxID=1157962 RepID=A0A250X1W3_9CHLO|nr:hypothetical protein CEUSTIGMA_g4507.t1 [Chlamydomonas eustigma]|eukprot:GAX77061.1 hypothetical protein CEUSTIGMA_g4507.t1 [Chlamydomonas eustigma]
MAAGSKRSRNKETDGPPDDPRSKHPKSVYDTHLNSLGTSAAASRSISGDVRSPLELADPQQQHVTEQYEKRQLQADVPGKSLPYSADEDGDVEKTKLNAQLSNKASHLLGQVHLNGELNEGAARTRVKHDDPPARPVPNKILDTEDGRRRTRRIRVFYHGMDGSQDSGSDHSASLSGTSGSESTTSSSSLSKAEDDEQAGPDLKGSKSKLGQSGSSRSPASKTALKISSTSPAKTGASGSLLPSQRLQPKNKQGKWLSAKRGIPNEITELGSDRDHAGCKVPTAASSAVHFAAAAAALGPALIGRKCVSGPGHLISQPALLAPLKLEEARALLGGVDPAHATPEQLRQLHEVAEVLGMDLGDGLSTPGIVQSLAPVIPPPVLPLQADTVPLLEAPDPPHSMIKVVEASTLPVPPSLPAHATMVPHVGLFQPPAFTPTARASRKPPSRAISAARGQAVRKQEHPSRRPPIVPHLAVELDAGQLNCSKKKAGVKYQPPPHWGQSKQEQERGRRRLREKKRLQAKMILPGVHQDRTNLRFRKVPLLAAVKDNLSLQPSSIALPPDNLGYWPWLWSNLRQRVTHEDIDSSGLPVGSVKVFEVQDNGVERELKRRLISRSPADADVKQKRRYLTHLPACLFQPRNGGGGEVLSLGVSSTPQEAAESVDRALLALRGPWKDTVLNQQGRCRPPFMPHPDDARKTGAELDLYLSWLRYRTDPKDLTLGSVVSGTLFGCGNCLVCMDPKRWGQSCLRLHANFQQHADESLKKEGWLWKDRRLSNQREKAHLARLHALLISLNHNYGFRDGADAGISSSTYAAALGVGVIHSDNGILQPPASQLGLLDATDPTQSLQDPFLDDNGSPARQRVMITGNQGNRSTVRSERIYANSSGRGQYPFILCPKYERLARSKSNVEGQTSPLLEDEEMPQSYAVLSAARLASNLTGMSDALYHEHHLKQ